MKEKKKISIGLGEFIAIIAILILALIILGAMIYSYVQHNFDKREAKEIIDSLNEQISETSVEKSNQEAKIQKLSNEKIAGVYRCNVKLSDEVDFEANYRLFLYKNGTFTYSHSIRSASSSTGTYIIDGNTLILNELIAHGGDIAAWEITGKEIKLQINDDGTITDKNNLMNYSFVYTDSDISDVTLNKDKNIELDEKNAILEALKTIESYVRYFEEHYKE